MAAPAGNQFWKFRERSGAPRKFDTPEDLWEKCCEYFEARDESILNNQPLPYTLTSLQIYLGVHADTWIEWRKSSHDLSEIVTRVDAIITDNKLTGAYVGAYNSNIVARDLKLADKTEGETTHKVDASISALMEAINGRTRSK